MKKYLTFEAVMRRIKYGTKICVSEEFTGNVLLDKTWEPIDHVAKFPKELLTAEATMFSVTNEKLSISVVKQEEDHA